VPRTERETHDVSPRAPGLPASPRRIVVLRANNIGDFIVATPALRALRARYPHAEITVIGAGRTRPIAQRLPGYINRFLEFPGFPGVWDRDFDAWTTLRFLDRAQDERYDLAIQAHGMGTATNPFTSLLGARWTIGFIRPGEPPGVYGLDAALPYPSHVREVDRLLALFALAGVEAAGRHLEMPFTEADAAEERRALVAAGVDPDRPILAVHPSARFANRLWPAERFAVAARALAPEIDAQIVVTGGPGDHPLTGAVAAAAGGTDLAGRLTIPALAALYARAALVLTNDSGPAHVAYAVGAPSVTIFGSASPVDWGPPLDLGLHAVVEAPDACHPCEGEPCIQRVSVGAVIDAADGVLAVRAGSARGRDGRGRHVPDRVGPPARDGTAR
jgi:ADP-heptose:LPS heptosyltransferase